MSEERFQQTTEVVLAEIRGVVGQVNADEVEAFEKVLLAAPAIFVTGEGRSGLVARCFAMRAMHLGLLAHVVGEAVTPALKSGDLLVAVSRSGETRGTRAVAELAGKQGAQIAAVTAERGSPLGARADFLLVVPAAAAPDGKGSAQFGGSLFEQSALLILDAVALRLQRRLGESDEQMQARHATLE